MAESRIQTEKNKYIFSMILKMAGGVAILAAFIVLFVFGNVMPPRFASSGFPLFLFLFCGIVILAVNVVYFAWQILLVCQYRPYSDPGDEALPNVSVIVPAFNEGKQVAETLRSLLESDYPHEKMEIITVNDGSRDDTWDWMYAAVERSGGRIIAVDLPRNAGKRNALYKGLLVSTSDIIITLDSDSMVAKRALRELVMPFCFDPKIGGAAGNIKVLNTKDGMIPRMLDVSFGFGFEFLKSAQSVVHSVLCQPGAFSAYRKDALLACMNEWMNETIFGKPAVIGEDRALTNLLLRDRWKIVFQRDAVVYSAMPTKYGEFCKMMIRWTRANVRENFAMFRFAFKHVDFSDDDLTGMQLNLIAQTFWQIAPVIFIIFAVWSIFAHAVPFILGCVFSIVFLSTLPAFIFARSRCDAQRSRWSLLYGLFSFLTLFWVAPFSVLTVYHTGWMTRQNPKETAE